MKLILSLLLCIVYLQAEKVLVLNSNDTIEKYNETIDSFNKEFKEPSIIFNVSNKNDEKIKEYLYDEYPDVIYAVGAKAYQYAYRYLSEKDIYFSSIVNWKRLIQNTHTYGISNEIHSSVHLTLIKSIFPKTHNIGIIYSDYTKNIINDFKKSAVSLGINIIPHKINTDDLEKNIFHSLINKVDSIVIIPDPILLSKQEIVKKLFKKSKNNNIAVFAYHPLFLEYGAILSISVDNPTTGRQIANMIKQKKNSKNSKTRVQYPAGTKVIFNKKEATSQNIFYNKNITPFVNEIIE